MQLHVGSSRFTVFETNDWIGEVSRGQTTISVVVRQPEVQHFGKNSRDRTSCISASAWSAPAPGTAHTFYCGRRRRRVTEESSLWFFLAKSATPLQGSRKSLIRLRATSGSHPPAIPLGVLY
jgi:hypothetical protein